MRIIPNVPPKLFTLSAIAVGYLLIDDTTSNEQNALGNWLMLTAQVLCTNAFYKQVQTERGIDNSNTATSQNQSSYNEYNKSNSYQQDQSFFSKVNQHNMKSNCSDDSDSNTIEMLQKMVDAIQKEINNLKNN